MNDKQLTALFLLLSTSFVFWLYNTGKLKGVVGAINGATGQPNGVQPADTGMMQWHHIPTTGIAPANQSAKPVSNDGIPVLDQWGNDTGVKFRAPGTHTLNMNGLETVSPFDTLNTIIDYGKGILTFSELPDFNNLANGVSVA